ncbi:hypothetical protein NDU88_004381 [Pleurodeles waltl]|uniref:Reverse transcriptase/retrotransposon-derived protein RNase H-like domain-containing protein n=1 Tax=Pleurodeles waltl TaxID=8319 RepID=A0AAV7UFZ6_PLEWA|nr:hypothetical protein NDU88_004381 [Pleurodeles waltl]
MLLKKGSKFVWSDECEKAFVCVKNVIGNMPNLNHFDVTKRTILEGLGAVLSQVGNGEEKMTVFASRSLKGAEEKYSVIEREALAFTATVADSLSEEAMSNPGIRSTFCDPWAKHLIYW